MECEMDFDLEMQYEDRHSYLEGQYAAIDLNNWEEDESDYNDSKSTWYEDETD